MNSQFTRILRLKKVLKGVDFYQSAQLARSTRTYGSRFAAWTICPDDLNAESVVYSFGVGEDVSFDLGLMEAYGMDVHAFDPSPGSIEWISKQKLPPGFHFHAFGLADKDGKIRFEEPADPALKSLRMTQALGKDDPEVVVHDLPVKRLETIIDQLGTDRIDVLKMDIEGAEYGIIDDICSATVPVKQVLIEFHHRFPHIGVKKSKEAIKKLNAAGFRIFHVSANGEEISFIHTGS